MGSEKKIISVCLVLVLTFLLAIPAFAQEPHPPRLVDDADLLTDGQEQVLAAYLDRISQDLNFDVVIVTVDTTGSKSAMDYADDYYDYNGYGMGSNYDGVLLLLAMDDRQWWVSTCGYGITAITDAGLEYMSGEFVPHFSDGDYTGGFARFAELVEQFVLQARTGRPYDRGNMPKGPFPYLLWLVIALAGGFLVALIVTSFMKRGMITVRAQDSAYHYRSSPLELTDRRDTFLYHRISRREKPRDSGSSGGSRTHSSSSGRSHGGGGGRF